MILKIDYLSGIPTYRQIVDGIKEEIAMGHISAGDELPSVRNLASQLNINPNTVARGYRELINEGLIYSRQGMGMFVKPGEKTDIQLPEEDARHIIIDAKVRGVEKGDLVRFFNRLISEVYDEERKNG